MASHDEPSKDIVGALLRWATAAREPSPGCVIEVDEAPDFIGFHSSISQCRRQHLKLHDEAFWSVEYVYPTPRLEPGYELWVLPHPTNDFSSNLRKILREPARVLVFDEPKLPRPHISSVGS